MLKSRTTWAPRSFRAGHVGGFAAIPTHPVAITIPIPIPIASPSHPTLTRHHPHPIPAAVATRRSRPCAYPRSTVQRT